jgi:3-methyladenine DNA glycosylase Tag
MAIPERIERPTSSDALAVISRAVFQAGLSWKLIESKWPHYMRLFEAFDPARVATFGEGDVERIMLDGNVVRTQKKIVGTIENARALLAIERDFGDVSAYLRTFDTYDARAADVRERFAFVGDLSAYYIVFRLGGDVPRFEEWERGIKGDHPRMREMIAHARANGWPG